MRWSLMAVFLAACGGADPPAGDAAVADERFVGRWFVEETVPHALYGASTYAFNDDFTIDLLWDAGYYDYPQGHVVNGDLRCQFGPTWSSAGDVLTIEGVCTDGWPRLIELRVDPDATAALEPEILSVGGDPGWQPPQWGWSFRKCTPDEACTGLDLNP